MADIKSFDYLNKRQNVFVLKTERIADVEPKLFKDGKYWNYYIRIYLDVERDAVNQDIYDLSDVSFVRYQLHHSYKQPVRIAESKENNFQLLVWTYGFYQLKATVFLKLSSPLTVLGQVYFSVSEHDKEVIKRHSEKQTAKAK